VIGRVIVVGSINVDLVERVPHLPAAGETVGGGTIEEHHGGKGANQAVAARRLGANVEFVGAVGTDAFGSAAVAALAAEGVGTSEVLRVPDGSSGIALILVDPSGENVIAVAPGANSRVTPAVVEAALGRLAPTAADVVLVSHEIPTTAARAALAAARIAGATTIFNPAPAASVERSILGLADFVTPNRSELAAIAIVEGSRVGRSYPAGNPPEHQATALLEASPEGEGPRRAVIVTLGAAGALIVERAGHEPSIARVPAHVVDVVDSTGAGDTFNGALAAGLLEGRGLAEAVRRAVIAAGIATTRTGAREGMPTSAALAAAVEGIVEGIEGGTG
jgi:ribokinase